MFHGARMRACSELLTLESTRDLSQRQDAQEQKAISLRLSRKAATGQETRCEVTGSGRSKCERVNGRVLWLKPAAFHPQDDSPPSAFDDLCREYDASTQ